MRTNNASGMSEIMMVLSWLFGILFIVIGALNLMLVHPVPGIFYLLLSVMYFPPIDGVMKKQFGFSIPMTVKLVVGVIALWGTLAVGDLAEILGL